MLYTTSKYKAFFAWTLLTGFSACQTVDNFKRDEVFTNFRPSEHTRVVSSQKSELSVHEKMKAFFKAQFQYNLPLTVNEIIVISSEGDCMNCNASYSRFVKQFIDDPSVLFLVCTAGNYFDVSFYLNKESNKNVFFDFHNDFAKLNLIDRSGAIFLDNGHVEAVMPISASTMSTDFDIITNRISKRNGEFGI